MATPTALTIRTDRIEYSRHEDARAVLTFSIMPIGASILGETATVELLKARSDGSVVVSTTPVTFGPNNVAVIGIFDLSVLRVRRGMYFVRVTADNDSSVTADSTDFCVALITLDRLQADYIHQSLVT